MSFFVTIGAIVIVAWIIRRRTFNKIGLLINALDELSMELEVAIRAEDFSALEAIARKTEENKNAYPFLAKIGDFKTAYAEYSRHYNQLVTKLDAVYKELEIRQRVNDRA